MLDAIWRPFVKNDGLTKQFFFLATMCILLFWALVNYVFGPVPHEDAFILFRYSENLAQGQGIVWNVGERPVEGATDFLWMIIISFLSLFLNDVVISAYLLSTAFIIATIFLFHWFFCQRMGFPFIVFAIVSLCYLGSPIIIHLVNGFSLTMFTFFLLASTALLILASEKPGHFPTLFCWGVAMLLCGLTRPEGNIYNFFLICTYFVMSATKIRSVITPAAIAIFFAYALPGIAYFLWRADYFGHMWPLPFYLKGLYSGSRLEVFEVNFLKSAVHLLLPLLVLSLTFIFPRGATGKFKMPSKIIPSVILFLMFYMLMELTQNAVFRFQYPIFILFLFCRSRSF